MTYNGLEITVDAEAIEVTFYTATSVTVDEKVQEAKLNQVRIRRLTKEDFST